MQWDSKEIHRMVNKFSHSAKLGIHMPQFYQWFMHNILYTARLGPSWGLIFDVEVMSIMLYMDSLISSSPL